MNEALSALADLAARPMRQTTPTLTNRDAALAAREDLSLRRR